MEFVVERKRWGRGKTGGSLLRSENGLMCCLGHCARQLGVQEAALEDWTEPKNLYRELPALTKLLAEDEDGLCECVNTELSDDAMPINDDEKLDDTERERQLIELFAKHGHTIKFE